MKNLLAKLKVASVTDFGNSNKEAKLTAVQSGSEENKSFSNYTPRAELSILINNPEAIDFFNAGEEIYISFSKEKLPDHNHLLSLLLNSYLVGYQTFKHLNIMKVIQWQLTDAGIKTFLVEARKNIKEFEPHLTTLEFLKDQLNPTHFELADTCDVNESIGAISNGVELIIQRLT